MRYKKLFYTLAIKYSRVIALQKDYKIEVFLNDKLKETLDE